MWQPTFLTLTNFSFPPDDMSSLLHIASRVEAAVSSYVSVRDFADTDTDEWRRRLDQEKVNPLFRHGRSHLITI